MRRFAWGAAIALVVMSACSSGKKDAPPTTTSTVATTTTTTVAPTTTTTIAETTTTSSTTSTSSTSTSTTEAPAPTTTAERAPQELIDAVDNYFNSYIACVQSPTSCDPTTFLASTGSALAPMQALLTDMVNTGRVASPDTRDTHWHVQFGSYIDDKSAGALVCYFDAVILLGQVGADGKPTIIDDNVATTRFYFVFIREGDHLLLSSLTSQARVDGVDQCAPV